MENTNFKGTFEDGMTLKAEHLNYLTNEIEKKQTVLESGKNIKTINGYSLIGEGNLTIIGDGHGGNLTAMSIQNTDSLLTAGDITFDGFDVQRTVVVPDYPEGGEFTFEEAGYILANSGTLTGLDGTWVHSPFLEIDRVEQVGVHEVTIALVMLGRQAHVLVKVYGANARKINLACGVVVFNKLTVL